MVQCKVVFDSREGPYIHTNHCIDEEMAAVHTVPDESTTHDRYRTLTDKLMTSTLPTSSHSVWRLLTVVDVNPDPANPHQSATCGGVLMDLAKRRIWAAAGNIAGVDPEPFLFEVQERLE